MSTMSNPALLTSDAALLAAVKSIPDIAKIDTFRGTNYKRWRNRIYDTLDVLNLAGYLTQPQPDAASENYQAWVRANKVCRNAILNTISNELYDVYSLCDQAQEIWASLEKKYIIEDAGAQKYVIANFLDFKMTKDKLVTTQIHDYHLIVNDLKNE